LTFAFHHAVPTDKSGVTQNTSTLSVTRATLASAFGIALNGPVIGGRLFHCPALTLGQRLSREDESVTK
jgi:hypothetical protein